MSARVLALLFLAGTSFAGTRYVDVSLMTGANDGSSWANAHRGVDGIQSALALAIAGDEIWVAKGTYKPTAKPTRTIAIDMKTGVAIRGGFAGGETLASQADPALHVTILSGDLAGNDAAVAFGDNSIHVVRGAGADATAVLDGFTIEGGNANTGGGDGDRGGGLLFVDSSHGIVRRCVVRNNRCTLGGGAGYIRGSSPTFTDCIFENNLGALFGGAFIAANSNAATFDRCVFRANTAGRAGGIEIVGGAITQLYNCLFTENVSTAPGGGGAIRVGANSTPAIRNCTIVKNASLASPAAGILSSGSTVSVANSIVYSNIGPGGAQGSANQISGSTVNVSYSCVMGGFPGAGNIDAPPKFYDQLFGFYQLRLGSPCIDAGDNAALPPGVVLDLDRTPRFVDQPFMGDFGAGTAPLVDMGAYEAQVEPITPYCFGDGAELPCPCGNEAPGPHLGGCLNSTGQGGKLGGYGVASVSSDSLQVEALFLTGMGAGKALLLQGTRIAQAPFHDGHLCINGTLIPIGVQSVSWVLGYARFPAPGDRSLSVAGAVSPGDVRTYQVQYRNAAAFCTPATVNQTNGVAVIWAP